RAPGVAGSRIQRHALAPTQSENGLSSTVEGHSLTHLGAHGAGHLGVADRATEFGTVQGEHHLAHHIPVIALENTVAIGEATIGVAHHPPLPGSAVVHQYLADGLADLLAVGAHVLDGGGADPPRD